MNYNALEISTFFIKKGVSPLKLQKLLYYSQLWFFVKNEKKLFTDRINAWIYGPVVHDVWSEFKYIKRTSEIPKKRMDSMFCDVSNVDNHLEDVWNAYGHLTGGDLVDLTHSESPWKNSRKGLLKNTPSNKEVLINSDTTIDFFLTKNNTIPIANSKNSFGNYSNF